MRKSRYSDSLIMTTLKWNETGGSAPDHCREQISETLLLARFCLLGLSCNSVLGARAGSIKIHL